MKALLLLVLAAAPAFAAKIAPLPKPGRDALRQFAAAGAAYRKADFEAGLAGFNKAIALFPGWKTATAYRAMCRWTMGDKPGAEEDAELGLKLKPNNAESFIARGKAYFVKKQYDEAVSDFEEAARQDAEAAEAHFGLGNALSSKGDLRGALKSLDLALRLDTEFAAALLVRGSVRDRLKDFKGGIADYSRVLEINPRFIWARYYRGRGYREVRDYRKALADFDEFLEDNPGFEEAFYLRSNVRFLMADYHGAESDLTKVIALNPRRGLAYSNRGQAKAQLGDREGAVADLRRAMELEPAKKEKIQAAIDALQETAAVELRPAPRAPGQAESPAMIGLEDKEERAPRVPTQQAPDLSPSGDRGEAAHAEKAARIESNDGVAPAEKLPPTESQLRRERGDRPEPRATEVKTDNAVLIE